MRHLCTEGFDNVLLIPDVFWDHEVLLGTVHDRTAQINHHEMMEYRLCDNRILN